MGREFTSHVSALWVRSLSSHVSVLGTWLLLVCEIWVRYGLKSKGVIWYGLGKGSFFFFSSCRVKLVFHSHHKKTSLIIKVWVGTEDQLNQCRDASCMLRMDRVRRPQYLLSGKTSRTVS